MVDQKNSTETMIMEALSILSPSQLSDLTHYISFLFHRHRRRLFSLLSSTTLFSLSLHHLQSLSLHQKSLLIARHLLYNLSILRHFMHETTTGPPHAATCMKLRDLDSVLLLLLLCEVHQHDPQALEGPISSWREVLCNYVVSDTMLKFSSGFEACNSEVLLKYIENVAMCRNFVRAMGSGGGGGKGGPEAAASVAAVVALPSVEVSGGGRECVICKEEMREGRDVCELPCNHLFHWMCILPWLKKRSTCPCCRYQLPTDDIVGEIERLLVVLARMGGSIGGGGFYDEWLCT